MVWGACKSRGVNYYKTIFHSKKQVFKCTCPSRKYPCKHGLALAFLLIEQPDGFRVTTDTPTWVNEWLKAGMPTTKILTSAEKMLKAAQRQKNFSKRLKQMSAGLEELENWILDTLRQGIASLEQQPLSFWKEISSRMVDAKLGGIGRRIRAIPSLINASKKWPDKVLEELASYYLLIRGMRKLEELPLDLQQDLLAYAGVNTRKEELFQYGQLLHDTWMVIAQSEGVEESLNYRKTWLYGWKTRKYGLVLDFAWSNNPYSEIYRSGSVFEANVVYYPSNTPLRVAIKDKILLDKHIKKIIGFESFALFLDYYATFIAANPWQLNFPCSIEKVTPNLAQNELVLLDRQKKQIPVLSQRKKTWTILALSGGHPINIFGEWTGDHFIPLSLTTNNLFVQL